MSHDGAILVTVGGGKGGVGKSVVSANLAVALARIGLHTVLVDADLGAANLHTMLGVDRPPSTLWALVQREVTSLEEVVLPTCEPRLFLVPGALAVVGAANPTHTQKLKLISHLRRLDADVVVVDLGAGTAFLTLDLFDAGDVRLVVTTPQLTAIQNAYAFVKGAVHRAIRGAAADETERDIVEAATNRTETERVAHVVARIRERSVRLADRVTARLAGFGGALVGNQIERPRDAQVLQAFSRMTRDYLAMDLPIVTTIPREALVHQSVNARRPFLVDAPSCIVSQAFERLAEHVVSADVRALRSRRRASRLPPERLSAFPTMLRPSRLPPSR